MFMYDHGTSKQKVKTIDIQAICLSIDYEIKDEFFSLSKLTLLNF